MRVLPPGEWLWPEEIDKTHAPAGVIREEKDFRENQCWVNLFCTGRKYARREGSVFLIYLQSFFSSPRAEAFSVARWQPRGFSYSEIRCLAPFDTEGRPIRGLPPERYLEMYAVALVSRWPEVRRALEHFKRRDVSLLCWCNPDRQRGYPKLFCHTILIGFLAERFGLPVMYLDGRENPVWNEGDRERFLKLVGFNLIQQKVLNLSLPMAEVRGYRAWKKKGVF